MDLEGWDENIFTKLSQNWNDREEPNGFYHDLFTFSTDIENNNLLSKLYANMRKETVSLQPWDLD